jgi:hypothetical protein
MSDTPHPPAGENVDTMTYPIRGKQTSFGGGTGNAQTGRIPSVVVGGSSEVGVLPEAFNGHFTVGTNKNVSTPVTG